MVGKKYWYVMYYIMYQYFTLDTNSKFASIGDHRWALYLKSYQDNIYQC